MQFIVYGYGAMGSAMAHHLHQTNHPVIVKPSPYDSLDNIPQGFFHQKGDFSNAIHIIAANRSGLDWAIRAVNEYSLQPKLRLLVLTKGLLVKDKKLLTVGQYLLESLQVRDLFAVCGPCIANELLQGEPTSVVLSGTNPPAVNDLAREIASSNYRVHASSDMTGCEWSAALKNIYAILIMASSAFTFNTQENFNAALYHAIHHELASILRAMGGTETTAFSLAGLGDIWVTCRKGRNGQFGHQWGGSTLTPEQIKRGLFNQTTVEGYELATSIAQVWQSDVRYSQFPIISRTIHGLANNLSFNALYRLLKQHV